MRTFYEWKEEQLLVEMSARRSFYRTLTKFQERIDPMRPVAVLTAFRGDLKDKQGQPLSPAAMLTKNREANKQLERELSKRGLSFYPVLGIGQEEDKTGAIFPTKEESYIIQPVSGMDEETFLTHVKELLFNAKNKEHQQWGAAVKLPSNPVAFLLHHAGEPATIADYNQRKPLGTSARVRQEKDPYYTQMSAGPKRDFVIGGEKSDEQPRDPVV